MTPEGYIELIIEAVHKSEAGNKELLEGLALYLSETDQAKQVLSDAYFSWSGRPLLEAVREVIEAAR